MKSIQVNEIDIEIVKKKIKNIHLSVHPPNGRVRLAVPYIMDDESIRDFALSKLSWIEKQRSKFNIIEEVPIEFISGEIHYFLGSEYLLNVFETTGRQHIEIKDNESINLYLRSNSTIENRQKIMTQWYRQELKNIIPKYIEKWEPIIGVKVNDWGVKRMKTRWGSCNIQAKRIWINLELAKKNLRCLEYIIVHEMVHLLERKHNNVFKAYMDKFLPNWKSIKDELNNKNSE